MWQTHARRTKCRRTRPPGRSRTHTHTHKHTHMHQHRPVNPRATRHARRAPTFAHAPHVSGVPHGFAAGASADADASCSGAAATTAGGGGFDGCGN